MKSSSNPRKRAVDNYGPLETENERVGTVNAETPEAAEDAHGTAALKKKRARGGKVEGDAPKHRLDRRARGGKVNGPKGTKINIIVAPGAGGPPGAGAMPAGGPPMPPPAMVRPAPPAPVMPPPGAMPPPGMQPPMSPRKDGGRVSFPKMDAGAASGEGRLEKVAKYGKKAKEGAGK